MSRRTRRGLWGIAAILWLLVVVPPVASVSLSLYWYVPLVALAATATNLAGCGTLILQANHGTAQLIRHAIDAARDETSEEPPHRATGTNGTSVSPSGKPPHRPVTRLSLHRDRGAQDTSSCE